MKTPTVSAQEPKSLYRVLEIDAMSASRIVQMKMLFRRLVWQRRGARMWRGAEVKFILTVVTSGLAAFAVAYLVL